MKQALLFVLCGVVASGFAAQRSAKKHPSSSRPPFPDAWESFPLKYRYEHNDSLYLNVPPVQESDTVSEKISAPPSSQTPEQPFPPAKPALRTFSMPRAGTGFLRVLIQADAKKWTVSVPAGVRLIWRKSDGDAADQHFDKGLLKIELSRGIFQISGSNNSHASIGAPSIRFMSEDMDAPLGMNGKIYRGSLDLYSDATGFQCLNVVSLEDYLRGVVPLEMGFTGPNTLEALKAQAVVARTYAYKSMVAAPENSLFDIRGSTQDQVYGGVAVEYAASDRAIRETAGLVVLYGDSLAFCYYHSTCGGTTANRSEVWGGASIPYLITRTDRDSKGRPWCRASKYLEWTQEWNTEDLAGIIRRNLADAGVTSAPAFHRLIGLRVSDRFSDGRINTLQVRTDKGSFELHGDKVRLALKYGAVGNSMLRSARFDVEMKGARVVAHGFGYGHGVGLCQMGALGRAAAGQTYEQILAAYYPGTVLAVVK